MIDDVSAASCALSELPPLLKRFDTKDGGALWKTGRTSLSLEATGPGRMPFACSRHEVIERLDLTPSRKMRPYIYNVKVRR